MPNLTQVFLHSHIPWIREYLHCLSTHFWTMAIPTNRASYSASLFVAEKLNLKDFLMVIFLGDTKTSLTLEPLWFAAPSTYTIYGKGSCKEIMPTDFQSVPYFSTSSSNGNSVNSTTKSTRTWPLIEVQGMYLISKSLRIVPHLEILPVWLALQIRYLSGSWVKTTTVCD